jgi:hypothetical protein
MSDDQMEHFDRIVQMQLGEFQRHILGATNSELCVVIIETKGVAQCATGSREMSEEEGKGKSTALIAQVAAAMIAEGSGDHLELVIRDNRTGDLMPAGKNMSAMVVTV